jgi:D-alanyl-D-alanine dipeptidase
MSSRRRQWGACSLLPAFGILALVLATRVDAQRVDAQRPAPSRASKPSSSPRPVPHAPPAPSVELRHVIGEYARPGDTVIVAEVRGRLVAHRGTDSLIVSLRAFRPRNDPSPTHLNAWGRDYTRFPIGTDEGVTFRVTPLHPIAELRRAALAATPPIETGKRSPELVELVALDSSVHLDIRYATNNNFMGAAMYSSAHAFMQRPAAEAVVRAHRKLAAMGFGLLIHDAYRPWYVTRMFWDATTGADHEFVADPAKGSRHNRGAAVDLTLYTIADGRPVRMPGGYDEFSHRSYPGYPGGSALERWRRDLLRAVMESEGFTVNPSEWWHFDLTGWTEWPIGNVPFEALGRRP